MYYLWFVICDKNLAGVAVTGTTVWKNPGGYLPGMMMPYLNFYALMSIAYLVLGVVWFMQYARFWRDILQLQNCITAVIALSMLEMATWYFDYVNFNASGFRPYGTTIWAATLGALRKAVSRVLVLIVAMGYGVVRPTLGGLSGKVMALGAGYFCAVELLDVMQNVGAIDDLNSSERLFLVLPVAVLDAIFILWIFSSLSKTLSLLQTKRSGSKLELYRKFTNGMALAVLVSVAWIGYEMYVRLSDPYNERWEADWITGASGTCCSTRCSVPSASSGRPPSTPPDTLIRRMLQRMMMTWRLHRLLWLQPKRRQAQHRKRGRSILMCSR
ncbi:hypothetical protein CLOM_g6750 [Closterium sp. NIES-68]|nr:hypothetical protein CLOM_g6750 [Closterium sp. NIES-68]